jgi:hypothetical protein
MTMQYVISLMCSKECIDAWELKYTRQILGKDEPPGTKNGGRGGGGGGAG